MKYLFSILIIFFCLSTYAQNETEIKADGVVFPSMSNYERSMVTPVQGQVIYNSTTKQLNAYNGNFWTIVDANIWSINGDDIAYGGRVGVGVTNPQNQFHVFGDQTSNLVHLDGGLSTPGRDLLEIKVANGTPGNGQFIEMQNGSNIVAKINTDGSAKFEGIEYNDGSRAMGVYAHGIINPSGSVQSGSNNFTCNYNTSSSFYEITLNGTNYDPDDFFTVVNYLGTAPRMTAQHSSSGVLDIAIYALNGGRQQENFAFVIYSRQ